MGPRMAQALKNQENSMLFTTCYAKKTKTGFAYFFVPPATTSPGSLEPRMGPTLTKPRKLNAVHYFLCKNQEHAMVLLTF